MPYEFSQLFQLSLKDVSGIESYLNGLGFLEPSEKIEKIDVAGEGNMNVVLRVITTRRSFILKQALPWVRRFPEVLAPLHRIEFENRFYQIVRDNEILKSFTPEIFFFDDNNLILCMEDFGPSADFTSIYKKDITVSKQDMVDISLVVSELHFRCRIEEGLGNIDNEELRRLNYQHVFKLPLSKDNGFPLDSIVDGLSNATKNFRDDKLLKKRAEELGELYLIGNGNRLLHGDYYPGSWLKTESGFRMIDPEFCFTGLPEFELGTLIAHLKMAQQPESRMKDMFIYYHFDAHFDGGLFSRFAGMEMIRRLIGLAQLPLDLSKEERLELLDEAYELVVNG